MKNQAEIAYVILFLSLIIIVILLTFYALSLQYKQNQIFVRYTSLSTISNYFLGYLYTAFIQQGYSNSYIAGTSSWNKTYWASFPNYCQFPPSCNHALNYYNFLLTTNYEDILTYGLTNLLKLNIYYPYNINLNFTNNYNASIVGDCSEIESGEYNYYFPIQVSGINLIIGSNSSGSLIPYNVTVNITNNPAFYLYNEGVQFSYSEFPQCSFIDCANALEGIQSDTCAQAFEQFTGNPYIVCNESIQVINTCLIPCKTCVQQNIACIVTISCKDTQYNVYYNGNTYPQTLTISSVVYNTNVTYPAYLICYYQCKYVFNTTNGNTISNTCNLVNQQPSCSPENALICNGNSQSDDEETVNYQYIFSIPYICSACVLGGAVCACQTPCPPPVQCPQTISPSTPTQCISNTNNNNNGGNNYRCYKEGNQLICPQ